MFEGSNVCFWVVTLRVRTPKTPKFNIFTWRCYFCISMCSIRWSSKLYGIRYEFVGRQCRVQKIRNRTFLQEGVTFVFLRAWEGETQKHIRFVIDLLVSNADQKKTEIGRFCRKVSFRVFSGSGQVVLDRLTFSVRDVKKIDCRLRIGCSNLGCFWAVGTRTTISAKIKILVFYKC